MSNPLNSLKKHKKPPLFLPGMPNSSSSLANSFSLNQQNSLLNSIDPENGSSPLSSFRNNYSNRSNNNLNKKLNLNELSSLNSSRVPFKSKIDDSDLLDEYTTKMAVNNLKKNITPSKLDHTPTDMDLMQIMMSKIKTTEARCAFLEKESREKDKKINILEEKLDIYKKTSEPFRNELISELERKNRLLRNKIFEIENFLSDYGLKWIGEGENEAYKDTKDDDNESDIDEYDDTESMFSSNNKTEKKFNYTNKYYYTMPKIVTSNEDSQLCKFECDYDKIVSNVKELNSLTEQNEPKIVNFNNNGAKFETVDSIDLTLYSNGISLYNGPFRSFDESLTKKFCIDITDGYFPSELQEKYPDGVSFNLIDKRDIIFKSDETNSVFQSKGYRLGSSTIHSARYRATPTITSTNETSINESKKIETQLKENPMTIEQFLNKLPSSVIKNGKIIDVRNDLKQLIKNTTSSSNSHQHHQITIIDKTSLNNKQSITNCSSSSSSNDKNVATLKIKSIKNENFNMLLKMNYTDTIQNLKDIIKSQRKENNEKEEDFDLASMYPRKMLTDLDLSLEQCELVPNANILIMPHHHNHL